MNSPSPRHVIVCLAVLLAPVPHARAQEAPHIGYVYPAGMSVGGLEPAPVEVVVGGQFLEGTRGAMISGTGIKARVIDYHKPMSAQDRAALRRRRLALQQRREAEQAMQAPKDPLGRAIREALRGGPASTPFDDLPEDDDGPTLAALAEARRVQRAKGQPNPQLAESVVLYVTASLGAEPGPRELRLVTATGVSNPLVFHVGEEEEYLEREPNDTAPDGGVPRRLPVVLNGQIMPGDVDRFRFRAAKGTHLVAAVSARSLIPYLADAVPGWFQATLTLFDANGERLVYSDDFRFDPDPVIHYEVPETGRYVLEIKDAIYRGREDFVYRITLGEVPFVTGVFPLGGRAGTRTAVGLTGWNLRSDELTVDAPDGRAGVLPISFCRGARLVSPVPFALDTLPESVENEPNDEPRRAQPVEVPTIVNGRIDRPGDWDLFRFTGRAGDEIVAEIQARRLGSPVDAVLALSDEAGAMLKANDDHEDPGAGLTTHHADSRLSAALPRDGTYLLRLGETQGKGGPAYAYRLRISRPRPDFELRVVPASLSASAGATVPITVYALRRDGFDGDIALSLKGRGRGFALSGGWIPSGQDSVRLTLTVPRVPPGGPVTLGLEGRAVVAGREVCRAAVPAEDMMQAFIYRHLVPSEAWTVSVVASRGDEPAWQVLADAPIKVPAGGTARVQVALPKASHLDEVQVALSQPPEGVAVKEVRPEGDRLAILLTAEAGKAEPGLKGNLIAEAYRETGGEGGASAGSGQRTALGMLPAIPFEVVPTGEADTAGP